jgi:hypothetical protein
MRIAFLLLLLLSSVSALAQRQPEWQRVYTFDESVIDMNTRHIFTTGPGVGSATFRWTFNKPEVYSSDSRILYKTRFEIIEFNCPDKQFRTDEVTLLDSGGRIVRSEGMHWLADWTKNNSSAVMSTLAASACALIWPPGVTISQSLERQRVWTIADAFTHDMARIKDFQAVSHRYFIPAYIKNYVNDKNTNWFMNLERTTAAKASVRDLQRYYAALMNTAYLGSLHALSISHHSSSEVPADKVVPPDLLEIIKRHPYAVTYGQKRENFDYLSERIDSVGKLRSFTSLLEEVNEYFRRQVNRVAPNPGDLKQLLRKYETPDNGREEFVCSNNCLALPEGTRIWEVDVPVFRLQIAEIKGRMQIVSALPSF